MLTCFACDINNKETRRRGKCICVLLIYHRERYGRDLSFKEKKIEVQETKVRVEKSKRQKHYLFFNNNF